MMAYTPTRADFQQEQPQQGGYRPTRADFMQQESPAQEKPEANIQDRILRAQLNQRSPFTPGKGEEEKYGDVNLNIGEKIGNSLLDYAPYMVGGSGAVKLAGKALSKFPATAKGMAAFAEKYPKWAKYLPMGAENAIASGAYGAANAEEGNRVPSALLNAGIGVGATAIGAGLVDPLLRYGAQKYAQTAIPEFTKKATEKVRELLPTSEYAKKLGDKFLGKYGENKAAWKGAEKTAEEIDKNVLRRTSPGEAGGLNASPYRKYIEDYGAKVGDMEPALRAPYMQSAGIAKKALELEPQSLSGAMGLRKNINKEMSDYIKKEGQGLTPENYQTKDFIKGLKENLKNETLDENKGKIGEEALGKFKNEWEGANKTHQELQEFYKSPQKSSGVIKPIRQTREVFENVKTGKPIDASIINKYVPSLSPQGAQGVTGLKHLAKLMGSKKDAVEAAKSTIFRKQIENGANTVDMAAQYAKLSSSQKKYMFGKSDEGRMLEAINKTRLAFGREPEKTLAKIGHGMMSLGVPGGLGFAGGLMSGESWDKSLMTGLVTAAASKGIGKGLSKSATVPRVERAINFAKNGTTNTGRNLNTLYNMGMNRQGK